MIYYVEPDQAGIVPISSFVGADGLDSSRLFASVLGASKHVDAPPVTPIKTIKHTAFYDAHEVFANNWKTEGLTPSHHSVIIEVDK